MKRNLTVLLFGAMLAVAGCAGEPTAQPGDAVTLHVSAAASLQQSFDEIAKDFTAEYPAIDVAFNYAGSSTLVQQLQAGAPADVLATADEATMATADAAELIDGDTHELFAANTLVGVVPAQHPAGISNLAEANIDGVKLVVCAPQVPCGALAQTIAHRADITLHPVSEEQHVTDVLGKVRSGQADAGLVYATDAAMAAGDVTVFELPGAEETPTRYPIARTVEAAQPAAAQHFIDYVQSDAGQAVLAAHGFTTR